MTDPRIDENSIYCYRFGFDLTVISFVKLANILGRMICVYKVIGPCFKVERYFHCNIAGCGIA